MTPQIADDVGCAVNRETGTDQSSPHRLVVQGWVGRKQIGRRCVTQSRAVGGCVEMGEEEVGAEEEVGEVEVRRRVGEVERGMTWEDGVGRVRVLDRTEKDVGSESC